jgi:hypothetical protein
VITLARLLRLIEPYYPKTGNGRQPWGWRRCCRFIVGNTDSIFRTRRPRTRSKTVSRCDASRGWNWATTWCGPDVTQMPELLHGQEREVFGDQAYLKEDDREFIESWGIRYRINRRPTARRPLS